VTYSLPDSSYPLSVLMPCLGDDTRALSSLSEASTLTLLQNNSFLPEIEEKLTLIPYIRLLLSTDKNKAKFIYNPTKRTIN